MPPGKEDVRRRLQEAALALYRERGYDNTTTAEIAARVGVTERTFFRYFPDKREVLFDEAALHAGLEAAIAAAPHGLGPIAIIHRAFLALETLFENNRPLTEPARDLIARTPALRERQLTKTAAAIAAVSAALQKRGVAPDLADLAAATGMAVFVHAFQSWLAEPALTLRGHLEHAFDAWRGLASAS